MASANNNTKRRKGLINEEDTATLLKRYSAQTILTLLKEIAQFPDVKIDWNLLVKKTSTGISSAYEYQMLWRHLAYCNTLPETIEEKLEHQPLDDDSDLEYELEAYPPVSDEASLEAAACVKVLFASGLPDEAVWGSATVEAPLAINIPDNPQQDSSSRGINITVPVSVKKELKELPPLPTVTTAEGLDGTGANAAGQPARKKRKPWTLEEDNQLIAAVKQLGKSNWANILKANYFKGDRTAAQLSQRWAIIGKRPPTAANPEIGGGSGNQFELKEQQLATNRAVSFALDPQNSSKPRPPTKKAASVVPNPMVQAAAVLAGARIATPSTAESLLKAAQSKTAVHMSTTGKSSMPGLTPSSRPYVHYIHTGSSSASPSVQPAPLPPATKGKKTPSVYLGVRVKEEKVQSSDEVRNSSKEVVNHSSKESMIKNSVKEEVEPEGIDMAIEDQTTQNPSSLPNAEAAVSDPMQLDYHHINNEKQNLKNLPGAAN